MLPRCTPEDATAATEPCWHLVFSPGACLDNEPFLKIEGQDALPRDAHVHLSCATEPTD